MFKLFRKDPLKKLKRQYQKMMEEARDIQRSGDLKLYARKIADAEEIARQIASFRNR